MYIILKTYGVFIKNFLKEQFGLYKKKEGFVVSIQVENLFGLPQCAEDLLKYTNSLFLIHKKKLKIHQWNSRALSPIRNCWHINDGACTKLSFGANEDQFVKVQTSITYKYEDDKNIRSIYTMDLDFESFQAYNHFMSYFQKLVNNTEFVPEINTVDTCTHGESLKINLDTFICNSKAKQELRRYVEHFKKMSLMIPYGFRASSGLIFSGVPGSGKTTAARVLMNELKIHINIVPNSFAIIPCYKTLFKMFFSTRIFVIDDLTKASYWWNLFTDQIHPNHKNEHDLINQNSKTKDEEEQKSSVATLGDFLSIMDGVMPIDQRIFIITTNLPQEEILKNFPAPLLRNGRFGNIIHFDNYTEDDIDQSISHINEEDKDFLKKYLLNK